jgi:hypothetical protein
VTPEGPINTAAVDDVMITIPISDQLKRCCSDKEYLEARLESIRKMRRDRPTSPLSKHGMRYEGLPDSYFDFLLS